MKKWIFRVLLLAAPISSAHAVTCAINASAPGIVTTVALQGGNVTVGQDVPVGTTLFRQYFKPSRGPAVHCDGNPTAWSWEARSLYSSNPKPLSAWNSGASAGKVYETGVPGIGVVAWYSGNAFPYRRDGRSVQVNLDYTYASEVSFDISFIKTGTIAPGIIRGQDLPTVVMDFIPDSGSALRLLSVSFNGTLNVVSQTCTTPNPVVQLGSYNASQVFKSVGTTTSWTDASLRLTNCPRFYGLMDSGQSNYGSDSPSDRGQAGTPQANTLGLTLKPNTSIIDATKGIIGLKNEANLATGVGIQLATNSAGAGTPAQFNSEMRYPTTNDGSGTFIMPLYARYIQTNSTVTPGHANATMTYTINYY